MRTNRKRFMNHGMKLILWKIPACHLSLSYLSSQIIPKMVTVGYQWVQQPLLSVCHGGLLKGIVFLFWCESGDVKDTKWCGKLQAFYPCHFFLKWCAKKKPCYSSIQKKSMTHKLAQHTQHWGTILGPPEDFIFNRLNPFTGINEWLSTDLCDQLTLLKALSEVSDALLLERKNFQKATFLFVFSFFCASFFCFLSRPKMVHFATRHFIALISWFVHLENSMFGMFLQRLFLLIHVS